MCRTVVLAAVAGVLGVVCVGEGSSLVGLEDCELVGCVGVGAEE